MKTKHLLAPGDYSAGWCGEHDEENITIVVMDANCVDCLREAAKYGALAAVRCCGVENAGNADEEIVAERDAAMKDATDAKKALMDRGLFLCQECRKTRSLSAQVGFQVPGEPPLIWCSDCKSARGN